MTLFYGWIVVAVGIVVSCIAMGTMQTLGVFLQPVSEATGWSRTGVSTAALLNWLCMGIVFYTPRFFLPMIPAYLALGFSFCRSGGGTSSWLGRRAPWRRGIAMVVLVASLWILVVVHIPRIVATERRIHARRPMNILEAARFLAEKEGHGSARVMARKGHIAYHAAFDFELFFDFNSLSLSW